VALLSGRCKIHRVYRSRVEHLFPDAAKPVTTASTLVGVLQRFGAFEWKYHKGAKNVANALSRRDVAGSVWRFCRAAQFPVVGTAEAVAAHREAFQRISIPGQGEDVSGDQGSAKVLTFDLSISLLKRLITGSQSLY
jgi:hypothetical protein